MGCGSTSNPSMHPIDEISDVPRWLQIVAGLIIAFFAVFCTVAALSSVFPPTTRGPVLSIVGGAVIVFAGGWIMVKAVRLIIGRPIKGGLLSPLALRVASIVTLCLPVGGLFTGYWAQHPVVAPIQSVFYVGLSFYLWRMARARTSMQR